VKGELNGISAFIVSPEGAETKHYFFTDGTTIYRASVYLPNIQDVSTMLSTVKLLN